MAKIRRIRVIIEEMETADDGFEEYDSEVDVPTGGGGRARRVERVRVPRPQKLVTLARAEAAKADSAFRVVSEEVTIETYMEVNGQERVTSTTAKVI